MLSTKSLLSPVAMAEAFAAAEKQAVEHGAGEACPMPDDRRRVFLVYSVPRKAQLYRASPRALSGRSLRRRSSGGLGFYGLFVYFTVSSKWVRCMNRRFLGHMRWLGLQGTRHNKVLK